MWHWQAWEVFGAEVLTVEVLCFRYQSHSTFPICVVGTFSILFLQGLQGEVGKMVGKGALKVVKNLGPGYYS